MDYYLFILLFSALHIMLKFYRSLNERLKTHFLFVTGSFIDFYLYGDEQP